MNKFIRFVFAMIRLAHAKLTGKMAYADLETVQQRQLICVMCENYEVNTHPVCKLCKCYLDPNSKPYGYIPAKTELLTEECAIGKWHKWGKFPQSI